MISVRCSSLDRLFTCHAARLMELTIEKRLAEIEAMGLEIPGSSGHAVQWAGSWCHHVAARRLRDEFGAVGTPDPLTIPATFKPSSYDEWVADFYVDRVTRTVPSDWAMFIEREVKRVFPLRKPFVSLAPDGTEVVHTHIELTGHIDHTAISPCRTRAVIDDLKRGYDVVDAAEYNWQLAGYTALLLQEFPTLERLLLRIHQPSAPERTTEAAITNPLAVVAVIEEQLNQLMEDPYTTSTGKPCKYCKALLVCPTFRKDTRLMKETLTKEFIDALPATASTEDLGELTLHCKKLEYPIKRVVDAFKARLEEVGPVTLPDGTIAELVEEDGPRKITDPQFAHKELARKVGETAAWRTLSMGVGAVEAELAATGMQKTSKKPEVETARKWVDNNLGGVISRDKQKTLQFR